MEYRILGPLEALDGARQSPLGATRQRAVLALLLLHANETLTRDVLIDRLWGEEAPATAAKVLQNCVSALRKELPPETIRTVGGSYALSLGPNELDRDRFERLLADGRAALAEGAYEQEAEVIRARPGPVGPLVRILHAGRDLAPPRAAGRRHRRSDRRGARPRQA